jgi:spoIIIJ-associated protein
VVDCENYRENREVTLNKLAGNLAEKATRLGKKIKLEPMNPYERRIIHSALSSYEGVKTESEGKEPNRYIVVIPDNLEDPDAEPILARNERRNDRNGRRNDKGRGGYGNKNRAFGNKRSGGYKKPQSGSSAQTGGTSLKGNDFFGIFLGNSNKDE